MKRILAFMLSVFILALCGCELADPSVWPFKIEDEPVASQTPEPLESPTPEQAELDEIIKRGKLIAVTCADYPPYEYIKGNEIAGIDRYVMEEIAKELGVELEILNKSTLQEVLPALDSGEADVAVSALCAARYIGEYGFSEPYFIERQYVVVRIIDEELLGTDKSLAGKTVFAIKDDSVVFDIYDRYPECDVVEFENLNLMKFAFDGGEGDAVAGNEFIKEQFVRGNGNKVFSEIINDTYKVSVAVKKGSSAVLYAVNSALSKLDAEELNDMYMDYMRSLEILEK